MIKVVLLDIDDTLLSFGGYVREAMERGFRHFGIGPYEDAMLEVFHRENNKLWHLIEEGELTLEELKRVRWNIIFEALGIEADGVAFEAYFRACLFDSAIPVEGALELLEYLHGRYTLCAASNGPYQQQVNRLRVGGMLPYFSEVFVSEEIGCSKPSAGFFSACLDRLSAKTEEPLLPEEVMIVGDSLSSDMAGGIGSGFKTCFFDPERKGVPNDIKVDYTVSALREIQGIL